MILTPPEKPAAGCNPRKMVTGPVSQHCVMNCGNKYSSSI